MKVIVAFGHVPTGLCRYFVNTMQLYAPYDRQSHIGQSSLPECKATDAEDQKIAAFGSSYGGRKFGFGVVLICIFLG